MGKPCPQQFVHSISTASRAYGVTRWQLGRRLADLGLAQRTADGRDFQLMEYAATETMEQIAGDFGALLNASDAAQWLGIARFLMAKLTDGRVVPKFFDDKNASPLYHPRDLDAFVNILGSLAGPGPVNIDWLDIPTAAHRLHCPTNRVTQLILKQRIPLRRAQGCESRFRSFRVFLPTLQEAFSYPIEGALTPAVAASSLGIDIRNLRALLDGGYIKSISAIEPQSGRKRRYVQAVSIERFREEFVSVKQLCLQSGRDPGAEAIIQADRGVKRLPLPERCHTIYRRADIN